MTMPRQLTFDLGRRAAVGAADFFVSAANREAHDLVLGCLPWPQGKLALVGPQGAGKSHLARIWADRAGARIVAARDVGALGLPPAGARIAVEDLQDLPPAQEEALFHLHNHLAATGGQLLVTADRPPARLAIRLPDLASRMQAAAVIQIAEPDDSLLFAVLTKLFADRQLAPEPDLVPWLVQRLERSYAAARHAVAALDAAALAERREITRALARRVLDKDGADGP